MNTEWTTFLQSLPEASDPGSALASAVLPLPERASIRVSGAEAGAYLQAILTQEVLMLTPAQATRAALCNAKGRTLSTLLVHPVQTDPTGAEPTYRLTVPVQILPALLKVLKLYVLRRKVTVEHDPDWGFIGVIQPNAAQCAALGLANDTSNHKSERTLAQTQTDEGLLVTWEQRTEPPRLSLQGPSATLIAHWPQLCPPDTAPATPWSWDHAEILDGIARITPETYQHFVPQWLNLDMQEAISFKKGCYPGQEVIARLHYLGKPNRRLLIGQCDHSASLMPGTPIVLRDDPATEAGEIVYSVAQSPAPSAGQLFLAVLKLKHVHDSLTIDGAPCALHPSPMISDNHDSQTH